jgi:hypothetical protein
MSALNLRSHPSSIETNPQSYQSEEEFEIMLQRALSSPTVQRVLPDLLGFDDTEGFKSYFTNWPVSGEPQKVRNIFIEFAEDLDRYERRAVYWKQEVGAPSLPHGTGLT